MLSSGLHQVLAFVMLSTCVRALVVTIPIQAPSAATVIAPDHVSLSIEQDRWTDWVGSTSRNEFFYNSLDNLVRLTGVPPRIRIGGQTADTANPSNSPSVEFCDAVIDTTAVSSYQPYPAAYSVRFGSKFYPTVRFLPKDTKVVTGINYGANDDFRASVHISGIVKAFESPEVVAQGVTLEAIELGHEPDRYGKDNLFKNWDIHWSDTSAKYLVEWTNWVKNIIEVLRSGWLGTPYDPLFWTASTSALAPRVQSWTGKYLVNNGLLPGNIAANIKTFSQHHYSGTACNGTSRDLQTLMTKSRIREGLKAFEADIQAAKSKGIDYVLGEANSFSCHGAAGVSNVAGSAIWALDYLLYASQLGISRVYFHQGVGYKFNFIQPTPLSRSPLDNSALSPPRQPYVQPSYYAAIIAAEAIGSSGNTRVIEIATSDRWISGYAFYEGDKLTKALFINSRTYLTSEDSRSQVSINLGFDASISGLVTLKRLVIPHAEATSGLTWGGLSYETPDARARGISRVESINPADGFYLRATEVALVSFST
ncbi:hypothetical protein MD484_g1349, partial [Candolleomyces efflorescens]